VEESIEAAFWLTVATLFYAYGGFSILLGLVATLLNRRVKKNNATPTPTISLIIAAYNEESNIAQKIDNILSLDYPENCLQIIIASDGSVDKTNAIISGYHDERLILLELPRQGKIYALNEAVTHASGEVLVFSDANTMFDALALRMLARNFADPEVGGVCGNQTHDETSSSDNSHQGESLYWKYDKWLKTMESRTGSIVSADGAIYAIRRKLYRTPEWKDVTDDFAISTGVIEQGYRLVFESEAIACEQASSHAGDEFARKVRIINRGLRGVLLRRRLLNPFRNGFYAVILFSHKILRRLVPFLLIGLLVESLFLSFGGLFYLASSIAQLIFYGLAAVGYFVRNRKIGKLKVFYIPFFFCLANVAALVAIIRLLSGKRIESWQPRREPISNHKLVESEVGHSVLR